MALVHYTKKEEEEKKKKEQGERAREGWAAKQQSIAKNREEMLQKEKRLANPLITPLSLFGVDPKSATGKAEYSYERYLQQRNLAEEMYQSAKKYRDPELMQRAGELGTTSWQAFQSEMGGYVDKYLQSLDKDEKARRVEEKAATSDYYKKAREEALTFQKYADLIGIKDTRIPRLGGAVADTTIAYNNALKNENPAEYYANTMSIAAIETRRGKIADQLREMGGDQIKGKWEMNATDLQYESQDTINKAVAEFDDLAKEYDLMDAAFYISSAKNDVQRLEKLEQIKNDPDLSKLIEEGQQIYNQKARPSYEGQYLGSLNGPLMQAQTNKYGQKRPAGMTDDQVKVYFALLAKSESDAKEYARIVTTANQAQLSENVEGWAKENALQGALAWVGGTGLNLLSGISPYSEGGQNASLIAGSLLQGNAERLNEKYGTLDESWGDLAGKGWGDVSQLGSSVLQSYILAKVSGGVGKLLGAAGASAAEIDRAVKFAQFAGTAVLGGSAAAADYRECLLRGMSERDATIHSTLAGINEAAFEYISLDKLVDLDKMAASMATAAGKGATREFFKDMIISWAAQSGIEASEEFFTTVANRAADNLQAEITGNYSQYQQAVLEKISSGMSPEEARKQVDKQYATDIMFDAIGGAISGGMGAAGQYLGPAVSVTANGLRNVVDTARYGELAMVPQSQRDAAWQMQAAEKLGKAGYGTKGEGAMQFGQTILNTTGGEQAVLAYAKDNGIKTRGTEVALDQKGQQKQARAFGQTAVETVNHMADRMAQGSTLDEARKVYTETVEKYGEGIKPAAQQALTQATERIATRSTSNVTQTVDSYRETVKAVEDAEIRNAMQEGLNAAVQRQAISAVQKGDMSEFNRGSAYLEAKRTSRTYDLEVSVKGTDGAERTADVAGITEDGKRVKLSDGTEVSADELIADADTKNLLQHITGANVGGFANLIFQTYMNEVGSASVTDGYRWLSDFISAFDRGRQGVVKLEDVLQTVELDHATAKKAFELGQMAAEDIIKRGEKVHGLDSITKKGATGRKGSVTLAKGLTNKRLREVRNSKNMAGFGLQLRAVRNIAEALGIDVVLHDSSIEGDKYTGWSGKYEDGKIHLDINGNRSFINDMGAGILAVTGHELTHWLQEYAPRQYAAYKVAVLQALSNEKGVGWLDRSIAAKQENHLKQHGKQMSSHEAEDEIVSDASEKRMGDEEFWAAIGDQLGEDKQGVKAAISKWIKKWLGKLREGIGMTPSLPAATRAMDQVASDIDKSLAAMYAGLVKTATENYRAVQAEVEVQNSDRSAETYTDREAEKEHYGAESAADGVRFSLRTEQPPTKTQIVYKLMRLGKDGNLYPLFIDSASGIEVGKWYDADSPDFRFLQKMPEGVFLVDTDTQTYTTLEDYQKEHGDTRKRKLPTREWVDEATRTGKRWMTIEPSEKSVSRYGGETRRYYNVGINGSGSVSTFALRPGWHAGSLPTMRQIGKGANKNLRDDTFVWVQGRVPADIDYQAEAERNVDKDIPTKIPKNGYYLKATNANATASQADRVGWYVAGSFIADRIMGDAETREVIDRWNAAHPNDEPVEYDYDRESGKVFNAETMQLEERKYSDRDTEYLELAKDPEKNRERLQEMVDEAARKAGYNSPKLYHGTNRFGFTVVDSKKANDRISFFATDSPETAGTYSGTTEARRIADANGSSNGMYQIYANTDGFMELDAGGAESNHIALGGTESDYNYQMGTKGWRTHVTAKQAASYAKSKGLPGVVIHNVIDTATPESRQTAAPANVYVFFNPQQQVKSADPVTYDDSGNVIPLSERFNLENEDIRYSERDQDANDGEIHTITNQQAVKTVFPGADSAFGDMKSLMRMAIEGESLLQARQDADVPNIVAEIRKTLPILEAKLREAAGITDEERSGMTTAQIAEREKSAKAEDIKDAYEAWRTENGYRESMREDTEYSDLELMENAAQALTEAGGEDYWNALLASVPELEGKQGAVQTQIEGVRDQARKARQTEEKLLLLQRQVEDYAGDDPARLTKRRFTEDVLRTFSIPGSQQADFTDLLNKVVDHVISGNSFSEIDARPIFDSLLMAGRVREQDEYYSNIRDDLRGKTIYVNETVRQEIGDDWNEWKRRAKNAGITITTTENRDVMTENGTMRQRNSGIDEVYMEMSEQYPGAFSENETSGRERLYNMIETSENGRLSTKTLDESISEAQAQDMYASFLRQISDLQQRAELEIAARSSNALAVAKARQDAKAAKDAMKEAVEKANDKKNAWKKKAEHNADLIAAVLESKRRDIRDLRTQINRQNEDLRKLKAEADKTRQDAKDAREELQKRLNEKTKEIKALEKEAKKARDVLAGKMLTPELKKLLAIERAKAVHQTETRKQEQFDRYRENKKAGELRKKIGNLKDELARRLSRPTDRSWVPAGLAKSMVEVLDTVDNSPRVGTKAEERHYSMGEKLRAMAEAYESIKNDKDVGWEYQAEYDEEIRDQIKALANTMNGRNLRDLSIEELQKVYDSVKQVRDIMRDATKTMSGIQFGSLYDAMGSLVKQQQSMKGLNSVSKWQRNKRLRLLDNLSVMRAVEMMSGWDRSAALYQLMQAVEDGVVRSDAWVMEFNKAMQALKTGKNEKAYRDALTKKLDYQVSDEDGLPVLMTKMQALQILMTAEREAHNDKLVHLQKGGAKIRDALAIQDGKASKAKSQDIQVTPELLQRIRDDLTEWDKAYMQTVRDYFKKEGRATNRVHYLLKHKVLQTEDFYVPYIVDKDYLDAKLDENGAMTMWVKSPGSTNALEIQSPKPVIIDGMDTVLAKHVREIGDYIGLALPIRDFSKVYNGRLTTDSPNPLPVKGTIGKNFDSKGQHLLTQAIMDVQGGNRSANWKTAIAEHLNKLQGAFVRSALLINPSVTIKQAASYAAAESILSHAALIAGNRPLLTGQDASHSPSLIAQIFAAPEGKTAQRIYSEIDAHTSMHYQRRLGMSQAELANEANRSGKLRRAMNAVGASMEQTKAGHIARKTGEMLNPTTWIQRMDVATTAALWIACKQQAKMDGMSVGSTEYWQHVTELYERCLRETQPMYDGLHRTANQKQHEGIMQYLFPFRTVPIQNHGQIAASYESMLEARKSGDKARMQEANRFFAKTVWAQTESAVVFALMTFLAAAMKRKTKKYRDEDEELDLWSVMKGVGLDVASTWFSDLFPVFGSELWSIGDRLYNKATGKSKYSFDAFSVGAVDLLNSLAESWDKLAADAGKLMRGEDVPLETLGDHGLAMVLKAAKIVGIPADTIKTYWDGFIGNVNDIHEKRFPALNDESWERSAAVNANRYLKAWIAGDMEKVDAVEAEMLQDYAEAGKSEEDAAKELKSKLTGAAKEAYTDGRLKEQDSIDFLTETGFYSADDAWQKVREWEDGKVKANFYEMLDDGVSFETAAADYLEHGFEEGDLRKNAVAHLKERYQNGDVTEDEAVKLLQEYGRKKENGVYRKYTEDEAWFAVQKWEALEEHAGDETYSYKKYDSVYAAIDSNKDKDYDTALTELVQHGEDEEDVRGAAKTYITDKYKAGEVTEYAFRNMLSRYCKITNTAEVNSIVHYADFQKQYPDSKMKQETVDKYYTFKPDNYGKTLKEAGIPMGTYVKYYEAASQAKGTDKDGDGKTDSGTKKAAIMDIINGLNLTSSQKDALYYFNGWSAKTISEAPWH